MTISVNSPAWRKSVKIMRVLCPLGIALAAALGVAAWITGNQTSLAVAAYCGGVSTILTYIQYRVFSL